MFKPLVQIKKRGQYPGSLLFEYFQPVPEGGLEIKGFPLDQGAYLRRTVAIAQGNGFKMGQENIVKGSFRSDEAVEKAVGKLYRVTKGGIALFYTDA